ncbi:hypothetical protein [Glycomyces tarimensis]
MNQITATIERAAELSGPITKDQADTEQIAASLGGRGFGKRAKSFKDVSERLEDAESIRQALEGTLVKAHWQLMSAVHGKMGPGSREHASFVQRNPDGSITWRGRRDGFKVEITSVPPELEHEPTGMELLEDREEEPGKLNSFRAATRHAARAVSDIKDAGKTTAQMHWNATHISDAKPVQLVPENGHLPQPESFLEVPGQGLNVGDVVGNSLVWAVGAAAVVVKLTKPKEDKDGR